jgi:carbon-monoxide dehydrogenase medium subunit
MLTHVAHHIAHYPIRTRGTFCGSLAHADPASEWCLVAATLGATMVAKSTRGERLIAAKDFFAGIMTTALAEDELLVEARLPLPPADTKFGFNEFSRRAGDFAMSAALVSYRLQGGKIIDARVGIGGAEPCPRRIAGAETALDGQAPGDKVFRAAAEAGAKAIEPLEDHQTNADYRRDLVRAVVRRALEMASA